MKYLPLDSKIFIQNRKRFVDKMQKNSIAIFVSNDEFPSNGDALQTGELIEPNLWENGRTQLDFQISKSFPKDKLDLKLNIKDILAQQLIFFEDTNDNKKYDKNTDALRSSQRFGRTITFTLTYTL